ncbi:hypothetical protein [Myxosarcina sp. GI1(2024)]
MNVNKICPCCSNSMLHCLEGNRSYWFCRHCWEEMPDLTAKLESDEGRDTTLANPKLTPIASHNNIIVSQF